MQTFDKIRTYPHGTNVFKVCESELETVLKMVRSLIIEKLFEETALKRY